jgi:hypothetical protein
MSQVRDVALPEWPGTAEVEGEPGSFRLLMAATVIPDGSDDSGGDTRGERKGNQRVTGLGRARWDWRGAWSGAALSGLLVLAAVPGWAESGQVCGAVVRAGAGNLPVSGAEVRDSRGGLVAVTDREGSFCVAGLSTAGKNDGGLGTGGVGAAELTITAPGFQRVVVDEPAGGVASQGSTAGVPALAAATGAAAGWRITMVPDSESVEVTA